MLPLSARARKQEAAETAQAVAGPKSESRLKNMILQYTGFSVAAGGREYSFRVHRPNEEDRGFSVTVDNAGFLTGKLKFQEGPDICYRKLLNALAAEDGDSPALARQHVTESELVDYKTVSSPKASKWTETQREAARQRYRDRLEGR